MEGELTLLNHPHLATFALILLVTYIRLSETLAWILSNRWSYSQLPKLECLPKQGSSMGRSQGPTLASVGQQGHDQVRSTSQWDQHRSGARSQNIVRNSNTRSMKRVHCRKIRQKQSSGSQLPHSRLPAPRQVGNTRSRGRGIVDEATAGTAVRERTTGIFCSTCSVTWLLSDRVKSSGIAWPYARHENWSQV